MLSTANKHKRDELVIVTPNNPSFNIKDLETTRFKGVTRFCHGIFPEFDTEKILDNIFSKDPLPEKYKNYTRESLKAEWENNRIETADLGTKLHESIEYFYNDDLSKHNDSIEWTYFENFHKNNPDLKPYRTEWMVYDEDLQIKGIIDMVFINDDGSLSIYDWKRCKSIDKTNGFNQWCLHPDLNYIPHSNFWHYSFQLNVYKKILERKYDVKVKDLYLVCFHRNNKNYQLIKCAELGNEVDILFKDRMDELMQTKKITK